MKLETVLAIPEVELKEKYWLDHYYKDGVAYRFGWYEGPVQKYIVVFRDKTRGPVTVGTNTRWED